MASEWICSSCGESVGASGRICPNCGQLRSVSDRAHQRKAREQGQKISPQEIIDETKPVYFIDKRNEAFYKGEIPHPITLPMKFFTPGVFGSAIAATVIFITVLVLRLNAYQLHRDYMRDSIIGTAQITAVDNATDSVTFRFRLEGETYMIQEEVEEFDIVNYAPRDQVEVRYLRTRPGEARLTDRISAPAEWDILLGAVVLIGGFAAAGWAQEVIKARRLMKDGKRLYGAILEVKVWRRRGKHYCGIQYLFTDPQTGKPRKQTHVLPASQMDRNSPPTTLYRLAILYRNRQNKHIL